MSEDAFRIAVTAAVALAAVAFLVQAIIAMAMYRITRKMQQKVDALANRADPAIQKIAPLLDQLGPAAQRSGALLDRAGATLEKMGPLLERSGPMMDAVSKTMVRAQMLIATSNEILEENRPRISEVTGEAVGIARTGREQVERFGDLLTDAGERARSRLEQIDNTVENTVEQVEAVSENVKRAVMRPVREVNGFAAGISAAVSTFVKGRKSSPPLATQDEEMFI